MVELKAIKTEPVRRQGTADISHTSASLWSLLISHFFKTVVRVSNGYSFQPLWGVRWQADISFGGTRLTPALLIARAEIELSTLDGNVRTAAVDNDHDSTGQYRTAEPDIPLPIFSYAAAISS